MKANELNKAAEEYAQDETMSGLAERAFKAGAEWMAGQAKKVGGVVHHTLNAHWIVTDQEQLTAVLKEFPEGAEVEILILARKEG